MDCVTLLKRLALKQLCKVLGREVASSYFTRMKKIRNYRDFFSCDSAKYVRFHKELLNAGIYLHPQQYEHLLACIEHTTEDVEKCIAAAEQALKALT